MVLIKGLGKIFVADFVHSMTHFVTATFCENVSIKILTYSIVPGGNTIW